MNLYTFDVTFALFCSLNSHFTSPQNRIIYFMKITLRISDRPFPRLHLHYLRFYIRNASQSHGHSIDVLYQQRAVGIEIIIIKK